jgi:hypothetical protein
MKGLLTKKEILALNIAYRAYKTKSKLQRKAIEKIFYYATGKRLGAKYYAIPIVKKLLELQN